MSSLLKDAILANFPQLEGKPALKVAPVIWKSGRSATKRFSSARARAKYTNRVVSPGCQQKG